MKNPYALERFREREKADGSSGVYFLFKEKNIIYVGQSKNIGIRLSAHSKKYDEFSFVDASEEERRKLEKIYIEKYSPNKNEGFLKDGCTSFGFYLTDDPTVPVNSLALKRAQENISKKLNRKVAIREIVLPALEQFIKKNT